MYKIVGYQVLYRPDAFTRIGQTPSRDELQGAVKDSKRTVYDESDGEWMIHQRRPHTVHDTSLDLLVIVPAGHDQYRQYRAAIERFEKNMTDRLGCFVNRTLRDIEEDDSPQSSMANPQGEPDEVNYPIPD